MQVIPSSIHPKTLGRESFVQLLNRLIHEPLNLHIRNNRMSPINLLLNLLKVISDARSAPFVAVTDEPTTLNKELASFASHGVKGLEDFLYVGHGGYFVRCKH